MSNYHPKKYLNVLDDTNVIPLAKFGENMVCNDRSTVSNI